MTDLLADTAAHEAGHAVIARVLGLNAGKVTIVPDQTEETLGFSEVDDPRFSWQEGDGSKSKAANLFALHLYAGAEAERLICRTADAGDGVDRERATACLAWAGAVRGATFVGDDMFDRYEARLRKKAADLVRQHRYTIERVAAALLEKKTLTNGEVEMLIREP